MLGFSGFGLTKKFSKTSLDFISVEFFDLLKFLFVLFFLRIEDFSRFPQFGFWRFFV